VNFLTKAKIGSCVQYAYAMTVLTRELGIPARFVVGYTGGTQLKDGSYVVKNTDAHAWTEVFFPSLGWIRFEPTPAGQGTASAPDYMTGGAGHGFNAGAPPIIKATQSPGAFPASHGGGRDPAARPGDAGAQPSGVGVLGIVEHPRGGASFDHFSALQHDRLVGELAHDGQVVADQDVGDVRLVADVGEQVQHLGLDGHIQRGDGLVEDQDRRLCRQRPGDRDALALAARQ